MAFYRLYLNISIQFHGRLTVYGLDLVLFVAQETVWVRCVHELYMCEFDSFWCNQVELLHVEQSLITEMVFKYILFNAVR